jgi:hypothetical protein
MGWIGVDLDGTLAHYNGWKHDEHIGEPIPLMVERVKAWIDLNRDVRIFTARVSIREPADVYRITKAIQAWTYEHIGARLPVTCVKDYHCIEIWDDRCTKVEPNTGRVLSTEAELLDL